ncbi:MAG: hypothetical protein LBU21_05490, partial [Treponema sp.]|nr:hypothetical protein [Treponema sp.]
MPLISKYRVISLLATALLCLAALLLGLSVAGSFFDIPQLISLPGDFFVRSYGALAFLIPLYFIGAAYILADPVYRPNRIFMLSASVVPFITLAAGFALIRDFDRLAYGNPFLGQLGRVGIGFCLILLILPEGLLIMVLSARLFPPKAPGQEPRTAGTARPRTPGLLPSPPRADPRETALEKAEPQGADPQEAAGAPVAADPLLQPADAGPVPDAEADDSTGIPVDAMGTFVPAVRRSALIDLPELKP